MSCITESAESSPAGSEEEKAEEELVSLEDMARALELDTRLTLSKPHRLLLLSEVGGGAGMSRERERERLRSCASHY